MLNVNYELIVTLEVLTKVFFTFAPLTLILSTLAYITVKIID